MGAGSQHANTEHYARGANLDGGKTYRLHLPPHIPVKDFWSQIVQDPQTRSMLQTDLRFASLSSQKEGIIVNPDSSVDVYFGAEPPVGKESNQFTITYSVTKTTNLLVGIHSNSFLGLHTHAHINAEPPVRNQVTTLLGKTRKIHMGKYCIQNNPRLKSNYLFK